MTSSREGKVTTKARRTLCIAHIAWDWGGRIGACEGLDPGSSGDWEPTTQYEAVRNWERRCVWDVIQFERVVFLSIVGMECIRVDRILSSLRPRALFRNRHGETEALERVRVGLV